MTNEPANDLTIEQRAKRKQRIKARRKLRMRRRIIFALCIILIILIPVCAMYAYLFMPNSKIVPFYDYYTELDRGRIHLVLENTMLLLQDPPLLINGGLYLPVGFVKEYMDSYIFWDHRADRLTITTDTEVMHITAGNTACFINHIPARLIRAVQNIGGTAYIPDILLMERYNVMINFNAGLNIAVVEYTNKPRRIGAITANNARVRYKPDIKSPVIEEALQGAAFVMFEHSGDFMQVRTTQGVIGYIRRNEISHSRMEEATPHPAPVRWEPDIKEKIVLGWDLVTNAAAAASPNRRVANEGVNVISPTWFSFEDENTDGTIISLANRDFVDWAHENGIYVWALISDNFNTRVSHAVLANTHIREYVIEQLVHFVDEYNLDGINIDYEAVLPADAPYFIQFLRELAPVLRKRQAVLSVDLFVPTYTRYYNRTEIAKIVDYVAVMTYDEHTSVSPNSGPVASLPFVDRGIRETLNEVPAEMVLMGLPFYNRVWREETVDGNLTISLRNYAMGYAKQLFDEQNVEFIWLDTYGYYYGEYTVIENDNEVTYKVWLEDARSIEEKMKIYQQYGLAGVACWRRGLESDGIWELIAGHINH